MYTPSSRTVWQAAFLASASSASTSGNSAQALSITSSTNASRVPEVGGGPRTSIFSAGSEALIWFQVVFGLATILPSTGTSFANASQISFSESA